MLNRMMAVLGLAPRATAAGAVRRLVAVGELPADYEEEASATLARELRRAIRRRLRAAAEAAARTVVDVRYPNRLPAAF